MIRPASDGAAVRRLLLIPLAALFAVHPLAVHGCSCGHDFDFHLVSWMEAARQFSHGELHPHWAYTPAFNAGEPRFVFYPPLSWALGAMLGLILTHLPGVSEAAGWNAVPILFTWVALTLCGLTLYRLARAFAAANAALMVAILYLANPYMLFSAYERTAYGELLAAAWIPLLLLAILRDRATIAGVALPVALLWLTNAPAAVMGCYTLALLAVVRVAGELLAAPGPSRSTSRPASANWTSYHRSTLQLALRTAFGAALGLGLAGFYLVPAAYERRFVAISMATIAGMRIDHNFLFEHTGNSSDALLHDQVLHTASVVAILLLGATAAALVAIWLRRKPGSRLPQPAIPDAQPIGARSDFRSVLLPLTLLTAGIAFLLTPLSAAIWTHAPDAAFLQFPWRLLAILAPACALSTAAALSRIRLKFTSAAVVAFVLLAALTLPAYHVFRQPCDADDTAPAQLAQFNSHAGTDPTDEYTPATADNEALKQNDPPWWLAPDAAADAPPDSQPDSAPMHLAIDAPRAEVLILNLRAYPAWHITLNGTLDSTREQRDDGLIALPVPAGTSKLDIAWARTPDQTVGDAITVLSLLALLVPLAMRRFRRVRMKERGI